MDSPLSGMIFQVVNIFSITLGMYISKKKKSFGGNSKIETIETQLSQLCGWVQILLRAVEKPLGPRDPWDHFARVAGYETVDFTLTGSGEVV